MQKLFILFRFFFQERVKTKSIWLFLALCLLLFVLAPLLAQLSVKEKQRILINLSFSGLQVLSVLFAIISGAFLTFKEERAKYLQLFFVRPISSFHIVLAHILSFASLLFLCFLGFAIFFKFYFWQTVIPSFWPLVLFGIFLQALLLFCMSLLLSCFCSQLLSFFCSLGFFIIGQSLSTLVFFMKKSELLWLEKGVFLLKFFPNFERLNLKSHLLYDKILPWGEIAFSSLYSLLWILLFLFISHMVLERQDFV